MLAQISTRIYCRGHVLLLALLFVSMNSVWAALPAEISGPFYLSSWNYRPLAPTGQAICILTKVAGKFDHSSDRISVEVSGDRWQLSAVDRPDDNQTYGTATTISHCRRKKSQYLILKTRTILFEPLFCKRQPGKNISLKPASFL